jgi:two-component system alkaline phosphatase synthesis response regulator PhoP
MAKGTMMSRARILLVDDDPELLEAVRIRLRSRGYEITTASDGVQATRLARQVLPDLVVLDIGMPGGDGHTVAGRLRSDPLTMFLPIIFLTARTDLADYERAREHRVEKYLVKPFQVEELVLAVDELVERVSQAAAV